MPCLTRIRVNQRHSTTLSIVEHFEEYTALKEKTQTCSIIRAAWTCIAGEMFAR